MARKSIMAKGRVVKRERDIKIVNIKSVRRSMMERDVAGVREKVKAEVREKDLVRAREEVKVEVMEKDAARAREKDVARAREKVKAKDRERVKAKATTRIKNLTIPKTSQLQAAHLISSSPRPPSPLRLSSPHD